MDNNIHAAIDAIDFFMVVLNLMFYDFNPLFCCKGMMACLFCRNKNVENDNKIVEISTYL